MACGRDIIDPRTISHLAELVEQEGADVWFERAAARCCPRVPPAAFGTGEFSKETDILDVWFDSGVSSRAVLEQRPYLHVPADLYLEGSDQHRGWFQLSLLASLGLRDAAPFKAVVTHGWTLTEAGEKDPNPKANFTDPEWVYDELGADILRLWVVVNYMQDVMISPNLLRQLGDAYRRIRNTFKFLLGNLADFTPATDAVAAAELQPLDRFILHRLDEAREQVTEAYERYEFYPARFTCCITSARSS